MYIKKISQFIEDVKNDFQARVISTLMENKSIYDDESEVRSWEESLPALSNILELLPEEIRNNAEIVLEAKYEIEEKRADAVIVGTNGANPSIIIIENKRWSNLREYEPLGDFSVLDPYHGNKSLEHPCIQADHYRKILLYTNKVVQDENAGIATAVFLQNATEEERNNNIGPFDERFSGLFCDNPIFTGNNGTNNGLNTSLKDYIAERIESGADGLAERIYHSEVRYSDEYRRILSNVMGNREALIDLLDSAQVELFDEIVSSVYRLNRLQQITPQDRFVYIVEGAPGTGKTFVAVALLSYLYQNVNIADAIKVKLLLKNKDPRLALNREMGISGGAISFGLKGVRDSYDCLICDESHRNLQYVWQKGGEDMRDTLRTTIELGNVSVFFYDEKQHVHINDYVTKERIIETARNCGIPEEHIISRELVYQHRCKDSGHFIRFIDMLLYHPERDIEEMEPFQTDENYKVALVENPQDLLALIRNKNENRGDGKTSRVLAGKGRTNGADWNWWWEDSRETETVGPFRNYQGRFKWNRRNYVKPETFATDSDSIGRIGCIDTSQGLDFEYVGVIIAPDLIYDINDNCVKVDISGHQNEDPNTNINRGDPNDIIQIIKNTYRVLLSRGEKGCYIYCCDEALQEYLKKRLPIADLNE